MKPDPSELGRLVRPLAAVEEVLEELLEGRARGELRDLGAGTALAVLRSLLAPLRALLALHRLGGRDVDHRRQQLLGDIGEAVGWRARLGAEGGNQQKTGDQRQSGALAAPGRLREARRLI